VGSYKVPPAKSALWAGLRPAALIIPETPVLISSIHLKIGRSHTPKHAAPWEFFFDIVEPTSCNKSQKPTCPLSFIIFSCQTEWISKPSLILPSVMIISSNHFTPDYMTFAK
jgi:hypothetical protein